MLVHIHTHIHTYLFSSTGSGDRILLSAEERHLVLVVARRDEFVFLACSQSGDDTLLEEFARHFLWIVDEGLFVVFIAPILGWVEFCREDIKLRGGLFLCGGGGVL